MKNGNQPAMACDVVEAVSNAMGSGTKRVVYKGLTKREHFAGLAMQAFVTNPDPQIKSYDEIASESVEIADALLKALGE